MNLLAGIPSYVLDIARAFADAGYPLYAVGGAVRAAVMGLPATDYDIAGPATPEEALAVVEATVGLHARMLIPRLGTLHIACGEGSVEYTTFRTESYAGGHTPDSVRFTKELARDALRRDFSCNALYLDLQTGQVCDPTGGLADIERKVLRATTPDPAVILRDDGLRVLRMVRFALQLRMRIDERTYAAADASLLADISRERLWQELSLILLGDVRYELPYGWAALLRALTQLRELGALPILLPGCACDDLACAQAPPELALRLAAWLAPAGEEAMRAALQALRVPGGIIRQACALAEDLRGEDDLSFRLLRRGRAHGALLCRLKPEWQVLYDALLAQNAPDSLSALAVDGTQVAKLVGGESPQVGKILQRLWRHTVKYPQDNTRQALLRLAQHYAREAES